MALATSLDTKSARLLDLVEKILIFNGLFLLAAAVLLDLTRRLPSGSNVGLEELPTRPSALLDQAARSYSDIAMVGLK